MSSPRVLAYMIAALLFFSVVFTCAFFFLPSFRAGGHIFAGMILGQFVAIIIAAISKGAADSVLGKDGSASSEEEKP